MPASKTNRTRKLGKYHFVAATSKGNFYSTDGVLWRPERRALSQTAKKGLRYKKRTAPPWFSGASRVLYKNKGPRFRKSLKKNRAK